MAPGDIFGFMERHLSAQQPQNESHTGVSQVVVVHGTP